MIGKIAWKNIFYKPLNTGLCVSLLLFGVAIISLLLVIQHQLNQKFEEDLKDIDLVIGAKGSPLQLVLSAVYHVDSPTGNINLAEAEKIMNLPVVKNAIPLAYGDSYQAYRILGTTTDYITKYEAKFIEGRAFKTPMEANISEQIANKTGLKLGDTFVGTHGEAQGGHVHDSHHYKVVGIFKKTNSVLDQLILTDIESVWIVHDSNHAEEHSKGHEQESNSNKLHDEDNPNHHDHALEEHNHNGHSHAHHMHEHENKNDDNNDHSHLHTTIDNKNKEITAVLLQFKTKMAAMTMPRMVNEQTNMQAVLPAMEINRLIYLIGIGATTINLIAGGIMLMACFSIFFALYSRLKERKYELALLRSVGYNSKSLFALLILEGFMIAIIGYVFGWFLSRLTLYFLNEQAESDFNLQFSYMFTSNEFWLLLLTILVGILAALLPAWQAMRIDISKTLSEK
jgi:putative ABC transport system permease protein